MARMYNQIMLAGRTGHIPAAGRTTFINLSPLQRGAPAPLEGPRLSNKIETSGPTERERERAARVTRWASVFYVYLLVPPGGPWNKWRETDQTLCLGSNCDNASPPSPPMDQKEARVTGVTLRECPLFRTNNQLQHHPEPPTGWTYIAARICPKRLVTTHFAWAQIESNSIMSWWALNSSVRYPSVGPN